MSHSKTFNASGIVLKRTNVGETDRVISLLTHEKGKLVAVAKGVRKLSSSKRAYLEPGNYVQAHFVITKGLPLLIQAKLINDCHQTRLKLPDIRKLAQFLEILERLFVEEELEDQLFERVIALRQGIVTQQYSNGQIKQQLENLVETLGYRNPRESKYDSVLDYVAALADKPMRSFEYLVVKK